MRLPLLAVICVVVGLVAVTRAEVCSCVDAWTSIMISKMATMNKSQAVMPYQYTGVIVGPMGSYYLPCVCSDVVRVQMTIQIASAALYAAATNVSAVVNNVTTTLYNLAPSIEYPTSTHDLSNRTNNISLLFISRSSNTVIFQMTVVIRGSNESLADQYRQSMLDATVVDPVKSQYVLPTLGNYTLSTPNVFKCAGSPPAAPSGLTLNWSNSSLPPTQANYTCATGKYVTPLGKGLSTCPHSNLTWTKIANLSCISGCEGSPPTPPQNSFNNWDNKTRTINTKVTYGCVYGFRSGNGQNAITNCSTSGWVPLPPTYFCSEKPCTDSIPQVPAHGYTDFQPSINQAGTIVTYSCVPGYVSSSAIYPLPNTTILINNPTIACSLGNWTTLLPGWECLNIETVRLSAIITSEWNIPLNLLTPDEIARRNAWLKDPQYIWMVTIPSIGAIFVVSVFCLCCTRMDSPLYSICNGSRRTKISYAEYMKYHANK